MREPIQLWNIEQIFQRHNYFRSHRISVKFFKNYSIAKKVGFHFSFYIIIVLVGPLRASRWNILAQIRHCSTPLKFPCGNLICPNIVKANCCMLVCWWSRRMQDWSIPAQAVGRGCRIERLYICREGKIHHNECHRYKTKASDGEGRILELFGMWSVPVSRSGGSSILGSHRNM